MACGLCAGEVGLCVRFFGGAVCVCVVSGVWGAATSSYHAIRHQTSATPTRQTMLPLVVPPHPPAHPTQPAHLAPAVLDVWSRPRLVEGSGLRPTPARQGDFRPGQPGNTTQTSPPQPIATQQHQPNRSTQQHANNNNTPTTTAHMIQHHDTAAHNNITHDST